MKLIKIGGDIINPDQIVRVIQDGLRTTLVMSAPIHPIGSVTASQIEFTGPEKEALDK